MSNENKIKIFLVDDDIVYLKMLEIEFLNQGNFEVETFSSGTLCLENLHNQPDVIILDYLLDGIDKSAWNGIDTLDKIKAVNPGVPVIILSQQDKIEVAVDCMHHKALDYVVKSETAFVRLQKIIKDIMEFQKMKDKLGWYMERM
jgi:DNA-binding NtrC family response regulator